MDIAFIGAGKIATQLLERVDSVADANVVAVCDIDNGAAETAANARDAAALTDHHHLFESFDFDVVFVAIPPFAYDDHAALAVDHGVDLFVEKPVALEPTAAHEVEELLTDTDILTSSGYVFRYDLITERAADLIEGHTIASLSGRYESGLPGSEWGYRRDTSGTDVNVRATHVLDVLRYLGGEVSSVRAVGSDRGIVAETDYDDAVAATLSFESGAVGTLSSSVASPSWTVEVDIVGDGLNLTLDYTSQTLTGTVEDDAVEFDGSCDRFAREVETFLEACRDRDDSLIRSTYGDAARTLELNWAVVDSLPDGKPVVP